MTYRATTFLLRAMAVVFAALCWLIVVWGALRFAYGEPPANGNPAYADWFHSLTIPSGQYAGTSCCSVADCRTTDYKVDGDHYVVRIPADIDNPSKDGKEKWLAVPPDKILQRIDNPTGQGVVCYTPSRGIMCFVRTAEG